MQEQPLNSVLDAMQHTPLVRLDRLTCAYGVEGTILAKLDYLLPGSSKKDRAAKGVIEAAEASGHLHKGQTVVELTSGNMGTGLAIVCALKGYPFVAVMSQGNSPERARMMQALGAEVVLVAQSAGAITGQVSGQDLALVEQAAQQLTDERGAFRADQFTLVSNWQAHFNTTGPEIYTQSGGQLSGFVDFIGSGGTYTGVTKALKQRDPEIKCYIVEPEGAAILAGHPITTTAHPIQGGGYAIENLDFLADTPVDGYVQVSSAYATSVTRDLATKEGIFGGFSGGANVAAAIQLLQHEMRGQTIAAVICDSGLKYLSTNLYL